MEDSYNLDTQAIFGGGNITFLDPHSLGREISELELKAMSYMDLARQDTAQFDTEARLCGWAYYGLSVINIIGAAILAGTVNSPQVPKIYPAVIGIIVAIITGIIALSRLSERRAIANSTAESIAEEINEFELKVGKYENLDLRHALALFQYQIARLVKNKSRQMDTLEQYSANLEQLASEPGQSANQPAPATVPSPIPNPHKGDGN